MKYFLDIDFDCNWVIVPANLRKNWNQYIKECEEIETNNFNNQCRDPLPELPYFAQKVNNCIDVEFSDYDVVSEETKLELLNCPFCNGLPELKSEREEDETSITFYWIECFDCGARTIQESDKSLAINNWEIRA